MTSSPAQDDLAALLAPAIAGSLARNEIVNRAQRLSQELMEIQQRTPRLVGTAPYDAKMAELDSLIAELESASAASAEIADE